MKIDTSAEINWDAKLVWYDPFDDELIGGAPCRLITRNAKTIVGIHFGVLLLRDDGDIYKVVSRDGLVKKDGKALRVVFNVLDEINNEPILLDDSELKAIDGLGTF